MLTLAFVTSWVVKCYVRYLVVYILPLFVELIIKKIDHRHINSIASQYMYHLLSFFIHNSFMTGVPYCNTYWRWT